MASVRTIVSQNMYSSGGSSVQKQEEEILQNGAYYEWFNASPSIHFIEKRAILLKLSEVKCVALLHFTHLIEEE